MEYREDLNIPNAICPPTEAVSGKYTVFRLVGSIPIKVEDIWSYRTLYPTKVFKDECIARACSVFADSNELKELRKIPNFKGKKIVVIDIVEKDGVLLKTPSKAHKSHISWWISKEFNLTTVKEAG
jgi:hypothetical protein